jgi:hypothetical protein
MSLLGFVTNFYPLSRLQNAANRGCWCGLTCQPHAPPRGRKKKKSHALQVPGDGAAATRRSLTWFSLYYIMCDDNYCLCHSRFLGELCHHPRKMRCEVAWFLAILLVIRLISLLYNTIRQPHPVPGKPGRCGKLICVTNRICERQRSPADPKPTVHDP